MFISDPEAVTVIGRDRAPGTGPDPGPDPGPDATPDQSPGTKPNPLHSRTVWGAQFGSG